ncbi:TPA: hypothetical protein DDW35_04655 [Candidatus Sumerlaeota bacterium]|nr:hypothetical protein [Candidatus Sumerlaeota bacterium]
MTTTSTFQSPHLHTIEQALRANRVPAAIAAFQELTLVGLAPAKLASAVSDIALALIDDLYVAEVTAFATALGQLQGCPAGQGVLSALELAMQPINKWRKNLRDIATERRARDLRTLVRSRDINGASKAAVAILSTGSSDDMRTRLSRQLGAILGSMANDAERAVEVMKTLPGALKNSGYTDEHWMALKASFQDSQKGLSMTALAQSEMQWNRMHTDAVVELMRTLPGRAVVGEPSAELEQRAYTAMHAVAAAYFQDPQAVDFNDVARIYQEFCPADERKTGPVEGVEDSAFQRMVAPDRLVSVRVLRRLGEKERLVDIVLTLTKTGADDKTAEFLVHLMGGLSNEKFFPFLQQVMREKRPDRILSAAVDSLGRIGGDNAVRALLSAISDGAKARVVDPPLERRLVVVLAGLGRIARSPKITPEQRDFIATQTFQLLPESRTLSRSALSNLCSFKPGALCQEARMMAVRHLVDNLWSMDMRSKLTKGDENQKSELGFRAELVTILNNLGQANLPLLLLEAQKRVAQYSAGAYWAMGETLLKTANESALPLLKQLIMNTLQMDDSKVPVQMRETYYDVSKDAFVPISRDKVLYSLVFAVDKNCGEKGNEFLRDIARRVRKREFEMPGSETESFLGGLIVSEIAALRAEEEAEAATAASTQSRPRSGEAVKSLLKDALGKGLFGVKIEKRISAIQELGARAELEAIPALCELLDATDVVLRGAAETALTKIVNPASPGQTYGIAVYDMLHCLEKASDARVRAITLFFARQRPTQAPLQPLLERFVATEDSEKLKRLVMAIEREPIPASTPTASAGAGIAVAGADAVDGDGAPKPAVRQKTPQEILALKQQYFAERKAWIASGKKGPEPKMPA